LDFISKLWLPKTNALELERWPKHCTEFDPKPFMTSTKITGANAATAALWMLRNCRKSPTNFSKAFLLFTDQR
jgi:hypothetical protein